MYRDWTLSLTGEDRLIEQSTAICLFIVSIVAFVFARHIRQRSRTHYLFFLAFGAAFALFGLEETSWGQRIMDIDTPEFFLRNSDQSEINIHNVLQQQSGVLTRHVATWCLLVYGVCLPLIAFIRRGRGGEVFTRPCFVPPVILVGDFLIAYCFLYFDRSAGQGEEPGEFFASLCFLFFLVLEWLKHKESQP